MERNIVTDLIWTGLIASCGKFLHRRYDFSLGPPEYIMLIKNKIGYCKKKPLKITGFIELLLMLIDSHFHRLCAAQIPINRLFIDSSKT